MNRAVSKESATVITAVTDQLRNGPLTAIEIQSKTKLKAIQVNQALVYLKNHDWTTTEGKRGSHYMKHSLINPNASIQLRVKEGDTVQTVHNLRFNATTQQVPQVIVCKPALKVVLKKVMEDNPLMEGELQRSVMKLLLVLV